MERDDLTRLIIGQAIEVHKTLSPGLLESTYQACLAYEIRKQGIDVEVEKKLPLTYKEIKLEHGYRIELLVAKRIVVEIKHVEELNEIHSAQVLTYMKLGNYDTGLILNFKTKMLMHGIKRFML